MGMHAEAQRLPGSTLVSNWCVFLISCNISMTLSASAILPPQEERTRTTCLTRAFALLNSVHSWSRIGVLICPTHLNCTTLLRPVAVCRSVRAHASSALAALGRNDAVIRPAQTTSTDLPGVTIRTPCTPNQPCQQIRH